MRKGKKKHVESIFDSTIDWDHHIWYWTFNILYQIWWSQSIVESKIDMTRFFPCDAWAQTFPPAHHIMSYLAYAYVEQSGRVGHTLDP